MTENKKGDPAEYDLTAEEMLLKLLELCAPCHENYKAGMSDRDTFEDGEASGKFIVSITVATAIKKWQIWGKRT